MSLRSIFKFSPGWVKTYYYFVFFEICFFGIQSILNLLAKCTGGSGDVPLSCNAFSSFHILFYALGLFWTFIIPIKTVLGANIALRQKRWISALTGFVFGSFSPISLGFYSALHLGLPYVYLFLSKWAILTWAVLTCLFFWSYRRERPAQSDKSVTSPPLRSL